MISQDEEKRIEYTAREKMVGDITTWMAESEVEGRTESRATLRDEKTSELRKLGFTEEQIKAVWG